MKGRPSKKVKIKAMPRISAANTHIFVPGEKMPKINNETWEKLEKIYKTNFIEIQRMAIQSCLTEFAEDQWSLKNGSERIQKLGRRGKDAKPHKTSELTKFIVSLGKTISAWQATQDDAVTWGILSEFDIDSRQRHKRNVQLEDTMAQVQILHPLLILYIDGIKKNQRSQKDIKNPFNTFVENAANILEIMGKSISARGDIEAYGKASPFVNFIITLCKCMPSEIRPEPAAIKSDNNLVAWTRKIERGLRNYKKNSKK